MHPWLPLTTLSLALFAAGCSEGRSPSDAPTPDAAALDASDAGATTDLGVDEIADAAPEPDAAPDLGPAPSYEECFAGLLDGIGPDYTQFDPVLGHHCKGTNHQAIEGVQRLVFLGDSVTQGTTPTRQPQFFRTLVELRMREVFGDDLEVENCAKFGARTDDLLLGKKEIEKCFPDGGDTRTTLVVFTIGGNDFAAWAQDAVSAEEAMVLANDAAVLLDDAVAWLKDPVRFPNGSYVVYANPYEYTDATGDLDSCPLAAAAGLGGNWIEGADAVVHLQERFMETAVRYGVDMIFSLEAFCGHGFHFDDPEGQCYRGPDAEVWFDLTCIHPNPTGHAVIADMFNATIEQ